MQGDDGGLEEAGRDVRRRDRALGGRDARRQRPQCMMMPDDGAELKEGGRDARRRQRQCMMMPDDGGELKEGGRMHDDSTGDGSHRRSCITHVVVISLYYASDLSGLVG
jgi:hypothetical protein